MTGAKAEAGGWAEHAAAAALADDLTARDAATAPPGESIYDGIEHLTMLFGNDGAEWSGAEGPHVR